MKYTILKFENNNIYNKLKLCADKENININKAVNNILKGFFANQKILDEKTSDNNSNA